MAITGDGKTLDTAYLVHDYWELKNVCEGSEYNSSNYIRYVKLANDIDCNTNDYSSSFEWEGVKLQYDSTVVDLNLNNKSIKNVMIANNSYLFRGHNNLNNYSKIHDGKILNVFCNSAKNIIASSGADGCIYCKITSVSMSVNGTSLTSYAFDRCAIDSCAIYCVSSKLNENIFQTVASEKVIKNSDFKFNINDCNGKFVKTNYSSSINYLWDSCRFSGKIGGYIPISRDGGYILKYANNIVYDIEGKTSGGYFYTYSVTFNSNGICNISKLNIGENITTGLTDVTSTEIKSSTELAKKGFVVTDIRPATSTT